MDHLFEHHDLKSAPLSARLRPGTWQEFFGHEQVCQVLRNIPLHSMILYGPPGCGKTTLAKLIAKESGYAYHLLSAVSCGVKEVRAVIEKGQQSIQNIQKPVILFLDEIHRFSRSQQDALLEAVEAGWVILIGATTQNPAFEIISPLLSRCRIYRLKALETAEMEKIFEKAMSQHYTNKVTFSSEAKKALIDAASGDARKLLACIDVAQQLGQNDQTIELEQAMQILEGQLRNYDKTGENHYDFISAFIKSMRGSDPDASILYLAAMLDAGEDPVFIARRMLIFASEDIGNASPNALGIAMSSFMAVEKIGMPEARIILAQTALFLASSPKSNASYAAIQKAMDAVKNKPIEIPDHLRNAPTYIHKQEGAGKNYKYPHNYSDHFVAENYFPPGFENSLFYQPANVGQEVRIRERLKTIWPRRNYDSK